ncbi:hypothetical protein QBC34DRAFT_394957 [Podospora aff. communis PSN243]|uniref:Uncharacterized protein n=1 Tax=Podospora aff. communis PSN243 TaxID=3040156 RepID=A0AAV9GZJ2_9PEZI|nr:hypothetical protein QBC34DRAFT_394957 [Podospora aff. communis PSN243]
MLAVRARRKMNEGDGYCYQRSERGIGAPGVQIGGESDGVHGRFFWLLPLALLPFPYVPCSVLAVQRGILIPLFLLPGLTPCPFPSRLQGQILSLRGDGFHGWRCVHGYSYFSGEGSSRGGLLLLLVEGEVRDGYACFLYRRAAGGGGYLRLDFFTHWNGRRDQRAGKGGWEHVVGITASRDRGEAAWYFWVSVAAAAGIYCTICCPWRCSRRISSEM